MLPYVIFVGIMSAVEILLMIRDKNAAIRRKKRTPEDVLLLCAALGGALGGLLAMYLVRHKTKHWYFVLLMPLFLLAHLMLVFFIYRK